jgi:hypothetical protein
MTKGLPNSTYRVSKSPEPNDPTAKMLYPYAYTMLVKDDENNPVYIHVYTGYSTLLNNVTRSYDGTKWEAGRQMIDYTFNIDEYYDENIIEAILGRKMSKKELDELAERKKKRAKQKA